MRKVLEGAGLELAHSGACWPSAPLAAFEAGLEWFRLAMGTRALTGAPLLIFLLLFCVLRRKKEERKGPPHLLM